MRVIVVLASVLVAVTAFSLPESQVQKEWVAFKAKYNKKYKDAAEETYRRGVFGENLNLIERHNLRFKEGLYTFKVGVNKNTDLLLQEIYSKVAGVRLGSAVVPRPAAAGQHVADLKVTASALPTTVDWRAKGYVTPVEDQGQCGSCWAFAANGALEGQLFKKTGKLVSLSEQNLVDCSSGKYGNWGCDGGDMDSAFKYIQANKGIDTDASYPYLGKNGTKCNYNPKTSGGTLTGFVDVKSTERDLQDAVAKVGPVAVAIDASSWGFIHYASGVYYECGCSPTQLDHAVLVVGYGTAGKDDYWLAKNSFGKDWGENGYVRMARNKNNHCGIASQASYPTV